MWIVKLALRRPYTFVVMALLIVLLGVVSIKNTPTDIFPEIDIPVVTVVWQYSGLSADQMAKQITTFSEYTISSAVDNVKNIESQTLAGVAVIRISFQPNVRHRFRHRAGHGGVANDFAAHASGDAAAIHHPLQRVERPHIAARARAARP
jgi:Cu/Ag efflux pump CusA